MATVDNEFVSDLWDTMVNYIPAKEKLDAAEALIKLCDDFGFTSEDLYDIIDDNKILETAFSRYFADVLLDEEEDDDWG
jgi:hypothetical protein